MKGLRIILVVFVALFLLGSVSSAWAQAGSDGADKLYVLYCGQGTVPDGSRWSPGINVGIPMTISNDCYLIHDGAHGYFLWDTGFTDYIAKVPGGYVSGGAPNWKRTKTLAGQLAELNVKPSDIQYVGISHTHMDHLGNVELFPKVPVIISKAEAAMYFGPPELAKPVDGDPVPTFSKDHPMIKIDEDLDVFKDGNIVAIATPGHTPGHLSALVHLKKTGWIILSGDVVVTQAMFDNRRTYGGGDALKADTQIKRLQSLVSMQRVADLMSFYHAKLWISHDKPQSDTMKMAPAFYE